MLSKDLPQEGPAWLRGKREQAWKTFASSTPLPFYRYGLNIITPLEGVEPEEYAPTSPVITIENQQSLAFGEPTDPAIFSSLPNDRFSSLHQAFAPVLQVKIPDNTVLDKPVFIRKTISATSFDHLFIHVGKHCKLSILEAVEGSGDYHSGGVEIHVDDSSSLVYGSIQNLSPTTNNYSIRKAILEANANLEWVTIDTGSRLTLSRLDGIMHGAGSSLKTKMMVFGSGNQHFDFDVVSTHAATDTSSDILQKAVLDGRAKMVMNGLVKIKREAARSNGYQTEDTLLLSPDAEAAPIPNLEIDNNDVRCSHGTTVGQVDKDILFYLMSRGLSEEEATRLTVEGFIEPLVASLPLEHLQASIRQIVANRLEERHPFKRQDKVML